MLAIRAAWLGLAWFIIRIFFYLCEIIFQHFIIHKSFLWHRVTPPFDIKSWHDMLPPPPSSSSRIVMMITNQTLLLYIISAGWMDFYHGFFGWASFVEIKSRRGPDNQTTESCSNFILSMATWAADCGRRCVFAMIFWHNA